MHSFMRSIGFGNLINRKHTDDLVKEVCASCDTRNAVRLENGNAFVEYVEEFAPHCGIVVCGEMDENGFHMDYYFPYFKTDTISSYADLTVEKHTGKDSFAGVCEDTRIGTTIIFYVANAARYQKEAMQSSMKNGHVNVSFTALASEGKILLPVKKSPDQALLDMEATSTRSHLIAAARNGDENAIESLTMEDMDMYNMVSRRIMNEDVFSIVETFFMPSGMECDRYQIMGEIQSVEKIRNKRTKEYIYQMNLQCNNMSMDVCINEADLLGDPDVGRRFKGEIWLQGNINFV